jgi:hypothetical protein
MIDEVDCGAIGGMKIGRGNRSTRRKHAPTPLCPPQIPHDQTRARTRAAAVGSQRLTAWAMARPWRKTLVIYSQCPGQIRTGHLQNTIRKSYRWSQYSRHRHSRDRNYKKFAWESIADCTDELAVHPDIRTEQLGMKSNASITILYPQCGLHSTGPTWVAGLVLWWDIPFEFREY